MSNLTTQQVPLFNCIVRADNGTAAIPTLSFFNAPTNGFFLKDSGTIGLSIGGTEVASWNSTGPIIVGDIELSDGTVALPSLSFASSPSTGIFYGGSNGLKITTNGILALTIDSSQKFTIPGVVLFTPGATAASPGLASAAETTQGFYRPAAGYLNHVFNAASAGGLQIENRSANGGAQLNIFSADGATGDQSVSFGNSSTTQWTMGRDTSATDAFVLSNSSALGTTNALSVAKTTLAATFVGALAGSNLSGTNSGDVTLAAVGSSPNANAASLSTQALTLQPASVSFPGVVTTGAQSFAGVKTFSTQAIITGTATNDNAAAGVVGEILSVSRLKSAATSATSTTSLNITSSALALTAGDWDVDGCVCVLGTATTSFTLLKGAISKTTATLPATDTIGVPTSGEVTVQYSTAANVPGANDIVLTLPTTRISLSGTTNIFLVGNFTFSASTATCYGSLNARRVR